MIKYRTCPDCGGFGDDKTIADLPCRVCDGTGSVVIAIATTDPKPIFDYVQVPGHSVRSDSLNDDAPRYVEVERKAYYACPRCNATGNDPDLKHDAPCKRCKGYGSVTADTMTEAECEAELLRREADDKMRNNVDFGD